MGRKTKEIFEAESLLNNALIIMLMTINSHLNGIKLIQIAKLIKSLVSSY